MADDIGRWLEGLGLSAYDEAFRANDVDFDTLRLLTAEDLQQIGVKSVGHRRRLLEAIASLGHGATVPDENPVAAPPVAAPFAEPAKPVVARPSPSERRQITVMFCDL